MPLPDLRELLTDFRLDLTEAAEDNDWSVMVEIDHDVRQLLSGMPAERKQQLQPEIAALKQCYQQILAIAEQRRKTLQQKMNDNRQQQTALKGYQSSMAAGNREVRASR
ncbi:hypothetical protein EOPP23_13050 [Endozoicomonas sp. OPT23]|uniref:hypothetical protein n=1 Tax=Endozoicomonas sp. OPT23 TaxID=2072845 RepID=UPI00129B4628|nr:hypothetical protein [Endozoicomonas sp. OPT23]MRI33916.1 hypothetical protein [Endozoicomonas sp. OPT23]